MNKTIVAFHTLGCKVNQNETEAMSAIFTENNYQVGSFEEYADVYVVNTCTVTHLSDRKSRQMIRRAKKINPDSVMVVTGCYAQTSAEEVAAMEEVDIIIGTNLRNQVLEAVERFLVQKEQIQMVEKISTCTHFEEISVDRMIHKTRAYLKVQEGCEQFCTYCIIPYARGPLRSRSIENTIEEAKKLVEAGFKEIILTGIHLGAYGQEEGNKKVDLADLCEALLNQTDIQRIRLSSVEPTEVSPRLLQLIKENERMCRHLHLPLQAGNDEVLHNMHRPYTTGEYRAIVETIRAEIPEIAISTDLMVGFPGETDDQFRSCLIFCDEMAFSNMHIFKYSPRTGTPAAEYPNQVDAKVKEDRSKKMMAVAEKNEMKFMQQSLGQQVKVLVEEQNATQQWIGHTDHYIKVTIDHVAEKGDMVSVVLDRLDKKNMIGIFVDLDK